MSAYEPVALPLLCDTYGCPSQKAARKRASVIAIVDHAHAIDDHVGDAVWIATRVIERRTVRDRGWIEHGDVRCGTGAQNTAVSQAKRTGRPTRHFVDGLLQRQQAKITCVVAEDTREGAVEARVRQFARQGAIRPE